MTETYQGPSDSNTGDRPKEKMVDVYHRYPEPSAVKARVENDQPVEMEAKNVSILSG